MSVDNTDPDPMLESDHWCRTSSGDTTVTTFTWTIEDFASLPEKTGKGIGSSTFVAKNPNDKDSEWELDFFPKGLNELDGDYLAIFLYSLNDFPVRASFQISILDSSSKKTATWKCKTSLFDQAGMKEEDSWYKGIGKWMLREALLNDPQLLPGGHLIILCEVTVYGARKVSSGSRELVDQSKTHAVKGSKQVIENLEKLFNDHEFSDVEIECNGKVFHCHQLILSTRSDVFRAMFQNDFSENRSKKVIIQNVDPEVVREVLNFIYTGVPDPDVFEEKTGEMLGAANRYQLGLLKSMCEDKLCSTLNVSNSIEYLIFGDMYLASKLRRMALRMVASNMGKLVNTEAYKDLVKNHKGIAAEIPAAMVEVTTNI